MSDETTSSAPPSVQARKPSAADLDAVAREQAAKEATGAAYTKEYACGCKASGPSPLPNSCPDHGAEAARPPAGPTNPQPAPEPQHERAAHSHHGDTFRHAAAKVGDAIDQ